MLRDDGYEVHRIVARLVERDGARYIEIAGLDASAHQTGSVAFRIDEVAPGETMRQAVADFAASFRLAAGASEKIAVETALADLLAAPAVNAGGTGGLN